METDVFLHSTSIRNTSHGGDMGFLLRALSLTGVLHASFSSGMQNRVILDRDISRIACTATSSIALSL